MGGDIGNSGRILVTGSAGFVARALAPALRAKGYSLVGLDLQSGGEEYRHYERTFVGDVRDPGIVAIAMAGCDAVFHLAAAHHDVGIEEPTYFDVNEAGTQVVCSVMNALDVKRLCFFSSCAVYGDAPAPRTEASVPMPVGPYGESKLAGERVVSQWQDAGVDRSTLVVRPTVIFGPDNYANMYALMQQIARGMYVTFGAATNRKSLVFIDNVVMSTVALWERLGEHEAVVANLVDKPDLDSRRIASALSEGLGRPVRNLRFPLGLGLAACIPFEVLAAVQGKPARISRMRLRKLFLQETVFERHELDRQGITSLVSLQDALVSTGRWYVRIGYRTQQMPSLPPSVVQMTETQEETVA